MSFLRHLSIKNLRNLQSVDIDLSPDVNLFYGDNGSGKTSLLESVSLLGLGRSFRSHKTSPLINDEAPELIVFSELEVDSGERVPVGIQKSRKGDALIRIAGETVRSAATLARQLPLIIINPDSFKLIEGAPQQRRQFLDWMVFHVKPEYANLWRDLQKLLKQRNSLLRRDKIAYCDIEPWDLSFCQISLKINQAREEIFSDFLENFQRIENDIFPSTHALEFALSSGWDSDKSLAEVLQENFDRDFRDGYTHHGPQRADIKIKVNKKPAADILSRGQEKALICMMMLSQASFFAERMERHCAFLLDDLLAELDSNFAEKLALALSKIGGQVLITGVSKQSILDAWQNKDVKTAVFHVKHGVVVKETDT